MKKKILAGLLAVVMSVTMIPGSLMEKAGVKKDVKAAVTLQNPRFESNYRMYSLQNVIYDCIWFGSYPQTEIVDQASTCGTFDRAWGQATDYEENALLYDSLINATDWNDKGEIILDGTRYRRVAPSDATYISSEANYYNWKSTDEYHYFRYDPIKWRVLNVSGNQVFLSADKVLDDQKYYPELKKTNWKNSTIRSWLNGYPSSMNSYRTDYTEDNFINSAFTSAEEEAINPTYLDNIHTGMYTEKTIPESERDENTTDKIFLLSYKDVWRTEESVSYGFYGEKTFNTFDEARRRRSTTYANAVGTAASWDEEYLGCSSWWLRVHGWSGSSVVSYVLGPGAIRGMAGVTTEYYGVCPAIVVNLSYSDLFSYAGTVETDGTINEIDPDLETINYIAPVIKKTQIITASNKTIAINSKPVSMGAKTNGNGKLTYKSSNTKVATISSAGKVTVKGYGTTMITITASETSTYKKATKTVTITVVPKNMKLKSVKSPKKGQLQVVWVKDKAADGYQIQISKDVKFKVGVFKKSLSKKLKKLKKPVTGLISKKRYYVRIRSYKKVSGKKLYGIWSYGKVVKIK